VFIFLDVSSVDEFVFFDLFVFVFLSLLFQLALFERCDLFGVLDGLLNFDDHGLF